MTTSDERERAATINASRDPVAVALAREAERACIVARLREIAEGEGKLRREANRKGSFTDALEHAHKAAALVAAVDDIDGTQPWPGLTDDSATT